MIISKTRRVTLVSTVVGIALASAALATAGPAAQAQPPAAKAPSATISHTNTLSSEARKLQRGIGFSAETKALTSYWTSARMKAAKSLDKVFIKSGTASKLNTAKADGAAGQVGPSSTSVIKAKSTKKVRGYAVYPNLPYYHPTARTNGKVFFNRNGGGYQCSATIVNSEGKSLVWTAGHCIVDGGVWSTNWVFIPSYSNGSRPYGTWTARTLTTTSGWYYSRDFTQDVGAVTMNRNFGYRITDYLGAQGLTWNQSSNYYANAFGYPAGSPYSGAYLVQASGSTYAGSGTIYMYSGLTGGSSGGAWLRNFDGNWGLVNGHNDFIYTSSPAYMYSPYYGNQVGTLYNAVRNQTS